MKALVTSGGRGTRLRPITHTSNKHLIPIANKPMIEYALEALREAGIREVGVIVNPETQCEIRTALGRGNRWGLELAYILQEAPLGLAHVVKVARDFLQSDPFVFYLGDNIVAGGIRRFVEQFEATRPDCLLVLSRVKDPERFGVAEIGDGRVVGVEEKPRTPKSPYAVTGIYLYGTYVWEAVDSVVPSTRGELEISDAHQYLIAKGYRVDFAEITGWWKDTGKPDDLLEANRLVLERMIGRGESEVLGEVDRSEINGMVIIEPGARIVGSTIRGPAVIGRRTVIEKSYVGPFTSIAQDCEIRNSELEYSIIMERAKISDGGIRIERSLVGREAEIVGCSNRPRAHKFVVGDQSRIELA